MGDAPSARETADGQSLHRVPSARTIARLMTTGRDTLSKSETVTIAAIEHGVPLLVEAREVITAFHTMIRKKVHADRDPWLERACASLVASFATGRPPSTLRSQCHGPTDRPRARSPSSS